MEKMVDCVYVAGRSLLVRRSQMMELDGLHVIKIFVHRNGSDRISESGLGGVDGDKGT